ncbi:hypothetical protein [Sphingomonas sp.]|uniref:hypothetical protein n=1 Tax=Sphingomonas sp. TaxID=28214 RepID=UPI001AFE54CD|nr:hypothetical protein [Sphingomonas sp.]MBO9713239.1 hypothetical protein [Sphingomonas sp.]
MTSRARRIRPGREAALHEGFLRHKRYRYLKLALLVCAAATAGYVFADIKPRPNGGSWLGYTLGTISALLVLWLTLLGIRKRAMTKGHWRLKGWTSAHVYLGLSLIVLATLHTGFQFGWNVHTLAYALMMLVIVTGIWGIVAYGTVPAKLSSNREEMTQTQMIEGLRAVDRQLHEAAQPLDQAQAALVERSLAQDPFAGGLLRRLSGRYPGDATARARSQLRCAAGNPAVDKVESLLERKAAMLARLREHLRLKAMLEVWLYIHVPATFALIAALTAHIVSVFFYW